MAAKKRRHRPAAVDAEVELLSKGRWSQFLENEKFHSVVENTSARERCKQLLVSGVRWASLILRTMAGQLRDGPRPITAAEAVNQPLQSGFVIKQPSPLNRPCADYFADW